MSNVIQLFKEEDYFESNNSVLSDSIKYFHRVNHIDTDKEYMTYGGWGQDIDGNGKFCIVHFKGNLKKRTAKRFNQLTIESDKFSSKKLDFLDALQLIEGIYKGELSD